MGAESFTDVAKGKTPQEAFQNATEQARYDFGHAGYTGTIAEKSSFVMIECPDGVTPAQHAENLIDEGDPRIDDKWGPAGCIKMDDDTYYFFGWASS